MGVEKHDSVPRAAAGAMATYLRAEIPRQFTVLGQTLLPFSLWHMELLMRFDNGFVTPDVDITLGDLIFGVFFCCQNYEQGQAALQDPQLQEKLAQWGESLGEELVKVKKGRAVFDVEDKALLFAEYLKEGSGRPELVPFDGEECRVPGAPLIQLLKIFLIKEMRLSISQAMNYSFALACHDYFAWHEQRGGAKIANTEEGEMLQEHEDAATSEEMLQKCLEALPGSVPINGERVTAKKPRRSVKKKARK